MLNNKIMIILSGIICIGFILCGILGILKYLFIQIIFGGMLAFFIGSLFYVNLKPEEHSEVIEKEKASTKK